MWVCECLVLCIVYCEKVWYGKAMQYRCAAKTALGTRAQITSFVSKHDGAWPLTFPNGLFKNRVLMFGYFHSN